MTRKELDGRRVIYAFDSFEEYLDRAGNPIHKNKCSVYYSRFGTDEFTEQLQLARVGWQESLDKIERWRDMLVQDISGQLPKPEVQFDRVGAFWDLGRVIEGDPECWVHMEPGHKIDRGRGGNIIRVVINTAASFSAFTASHTNRAGAILALTQLLEMLGYYVQFEITTAINLDYNRLEFRTISKYPSEALNLPCVAYWTSRNMERHIDFAICETLPECYRPGTKDPYTKLLRPGVTCYGAVDETLDKGDICFDGMTQHSVNWHNEDAVRLYVKDQLRLQGVVFEEDLFKEIN